MRWPTATLVMLAVAIGAVSCESELSVEEQLKYITVRMNTMAAQHTIESAAARKEVDNLREELKACMTCNEKRNSQLTLEWAMDTVAELRREMRELEAATNASGWQQELRNEVATILVEAEGVTKLAAADGARLAAGEARDAELMLDIRQIRDIASVAKTTCDSVKNDVERMQRNIKTQYRVLNKKINMQIREDFPAMKNDVIESSYDNHKMRHSVHKQIDDLKRAHHNIYVMHRQMKSHLKEMQKNVDSLMEKDSEGDNRVRQLMETHERQSDSIKNISVEVANFNKLHASMLELLENMETLENKVDKTVPDFRKEISKLDLDVAQIRSYNSYLKDDQENIHRSMKAVVVSVSNLVDKVNNDRSALEVLNSTVNRIEDNCQNNSQMEDDRKVEEEVEIFEKKPIQHCVENEDVNTVRLLEVEGGNPILTSCDSGWILIQKRTNGSLDFNRNYQEYADGFGDPLGEFWIGNEALHRLTMNNCTSLRIDMLDVEGEHWRADYDHFRVGPASSGYRLRVGGYSGNATDALAFQDDMEFSTVDKDRDTSRNNCAASYQGGWWFSHCQHANLNGKYLLGLTWFNTVKNEWITMSRSRMSIRKKDGCRDGS